VNSALSSASLALLLAALVALVWSASDVAGARSGGSPTLVIDNSFALDTSDPQRAFDPTSTIIDRALYDTLFTFRGNDPTRPVPSLVRSWTSTGARRFTFRLRRDVRFADGTPLTSTDVVFSFKRLVNLKGNPAHLLAGMTFAAPDAYTVVVSSATPVPQLPTILTTPATGIVNSKLVVAHGGTDAVDAASADTAEQWFNSASSAGAGSGPYELESYNPDSQVTLRANTAYWGTKKSGFQTVVIRNMAAPEQSLSIRRGGHQIAIDLSSDDASGLASVAGLHVTLQPSPWVFYAFANDDSRVSTVTPNPEFQQAVRHALDYGELVSAAGPGTIQAAGLIPSLILGALPQTDAVQQDLTAAKAELAASGATGKRLTLEYPSDVTIDGVPFSTLAQKVQAELQQAGFDVDLDGSPVATFQPAFRAGKIAFGLWLYSYDYPDPADYLVFSPGSLIALHAGWTAGSDPEVERLAARAARAITPKARSVLYREIQLGMNARSPFMPLIQPTQVFAATTDLKGAVFSGAYDVDIGQVFPK
jgi:peptide/nickel transport system substrate-binding protein